MNAHDMLPSDSEPDACTCGDCSRTVPVCAHCAYHARDCTCKPVPFSITGPGEYKTRNGRMAIIAGKVRDLWCGLIIAPSAVAPKAWSNEGNDNAGYSHSEYGTDIISVWTEPRKPIEGWVNIYTFGEGGLIHKSKEQATRYAKSSPSVSAYKLIATVKVREVTDD